MSRAISDANASRASSSMETVVRAPSVHRRAESRTAEVGENTILGDGGMMGIGCCVCFVDGPGQFDSYIAAPKTQVGRAIFVALAAACTSWHYGLV